MPPAAFGPSRYGLKELDFELGDALGELAGEYWYPVDQIVDRYIAWYESIPRVATGLHALSAMDQDDQNDEFFELASALAPLVEGGEAEVAHWLQQEVVMEERHAARRELIIRSIARDAHDRFLRRHSDVIVSRSISEAFEWIGLTVVGGVTGNLAYDILKKAWGHGWRSIVRRLRRNPRPLGVDHDAVLLHLIRIAIREQCRRVQFPVPEIEQLRVTNWQPGVQSVAVEVRSDSPEIRAVVEVPYVDLNSRGVRVSLARSSP